ncbi:MAG TPA: O-antigen ligase family protein [Thermoanaerobaculia bacterium]
MKDELHPALLVRCSAFLYIAHILLLGKIALLELTAFWCIFYLCWSIARREARFSFHILYFPLIVYGLASTLSALAARDRVHAYGEAMLWFKMLIFPAALMLLREVPRLREWLLYVYAIFGGGIACWGLLEFVFERKRDLEHRINGPVSHVMTFSGLLMTMSLVFLVLWWHQRKHWQLAVVITTTIALVLTYTRSAWLGWMAAVLVLIFATRARRLALYLAPIALLVITFLPLPIFGRLISTFDFEQTSNFDRIRMTEAGVEMIRDYPVLGVGPANVKDEYALYRKHDAPRARPPHLHSNIIQLWAERGILGLAAYITFIALFLRECIRAWNTPRKMWGQAGIAVMVALAVAGLFEFNFGDTEVFFLMLNVMAFILAWIEQPEPRTNTAVPSLVPATT